MKLAQLTEKELRKSIYDLRRELRADIKEIRGLAKSDPLIPTYALTYMTDIEKYMRNKAVKYMSFNELKNVYRELTYIRGLESSKVSSAISTGRRFEVLRPNLESLS